jgi:protein-S-isoprenylcysteine O-methyltransferase Ste14
MNQLATRALLGLAQLMAVLAILLFGPAWTVNYPEAWAYLCVFGGSAGLISVYLWNKDPQLLERRLKAGPGAEQETSQNVIQAIAAVAFISIFIVSSLDHRFSWSNVSLPLVIVGDVLVAVGFFGVFTVFKANSFTAATIQVAADQQVISAGPYAIVRHPMYSGALLLLLGTPLALGSFWGLLMVIPITLAIIWRLLDEEQFLSKNLYGYTAYCQKVRYRLVPFVW